MKYHIQKLHANDFDVFEENKLPARSYFIPYGDPKALRSQSALTVRAKSDRVTLLSGDWQFAYFEKISRLPTNFDTEKRSFDTVAVPSTWQRTGYEMPVYLNTRYEFPMTLPVVPEDMSCGVYVKKFHVREETKHCILTFLGVCSSLTLYVNGQYVGYSEGSHNPAEFLLDGVVTSGENELLAIVTKWSNGTYLECQDMFRENGIFRDVYLTETADCYFFDVQVKPEKSDDGWHLFVNGELSGERFSGKTLSAELFDGETSLRSQSCGAASQFSFFFALDSVEPWTAETPKLYDLLLSLSDSGDTLECVRVRVGFKTVTIDGERFLFNDTLIKMKGVNHHDTDPKNGYVMTPEALERDVRLMKAFNVNAVRTSHYPPDPIFLDLCDQYGLYVVDEADIETHGTQFDEELHFNLLKMNAISNDKAWQPRFVDRVRRMYERDKNHPAITMWSLGNESGGWKNQDACYAWLKERSDIPVHYEGVIRTVRGSYDVISEMYQHPTLIARIAKHALTSRYSGKPYFLCEYCHAMGLGPGALEEYWKLIYSSENLMGGCIWEFADHAVFHEKGKYRYTYGGDHGERIHDGNFCVDGLFDPNRRPHTGAYAMQAVYRPIRAAFVSDNLYRFVNTNSFVNANIYQVRYELLQDGKVIDGGAVALDIPPRQSQTVVIAHSMTDTFHAYDINFIYADHLGNFVAKEQIHLREQLQMPLIRRGGAVAYSKKKNGIVVAFDGGRAIFSRSTGVLLGYSVGGRELLADDYGFVPNIYRAPLDNDRNKVKHWQKKGFDRLRTAGMKLTECKNDREGYVKIKSVGNLSFADKKVFSFALEYRLFPDGTLHVDAKLLRARFAVGTQELSRFGVAINLNPALENVRYYGMGEHENLPDFLSQSTMGIYESTVHDLCEPYIKPQENGMHTGTQVLSLFDDNGNGLILTCDSAPFTFSARPYTNETLRKAKHLEDLHDDGCVSLNIDGFVRGTGTHSCGPDVLPAYDLQMKDSLEFRFFLQPGSNLCS